MGTNFSTLFRCMSSRCLFLFAVALVGMAITSAPVSAQDNVPYFCDGSSGNLCNLFQLDGSANANANANTCVSGEFMCPAGEQNPQWPADWDALLYPALTLHGSVPVVGSGSAPGAYNFTLPWPNGFGSFSGVITSSLVATGTSTILKQGTKNTDDLSKWVVASQSSPPKDSFLAGALATYVAPPNPPDSSTYAGHQLVYFGSTRIAPNGSAAIGIWFFQQNVAVCASGKAMCIAGTNTPANHQDKDLFLFIAYGGSGKATIQMATWVGNGVSGHLGAGSSLVTCPTGGDQACAVTNETSSIVLGKSTTQFQAPGSGFNVSGTGFAGFPNGVIPALQFEEGGVDFNAAFGGQAPCFSSVLFGAVASGSAPSTASMKSILLGSFNTCAISATKECQAGTINGSNVTYPIDGTVENVGSGSITNLALSDTYAGNSQPFDATPTCACSNSGCTITGTSCSTVTLNPGGTVTYNASITGQNGGDNIITASMGGVGGGTATAQSSTAHCTALSFNTGITIIKNCSPGATLDDQTVPGKIVVKVGVGGTVTNNNQGNLGLSSIQVYDCLGGSWVGSVPNIDPTNKSSCTGTITGPFSLSDLPAGDSEAWSETYFPSAAPTCGPYNFSDQALVVGSCTSQFCKTSSVENISDSKTCPLCPGPTCN